MKRKEQDNKLQSGLQAYADSVEASGALTGFRQRLGNWPVYAAAAGSALAFSTSATANTIVYNGSSSGFGTNVGANIDGNGFGVFVTGGVSSIVSTPMFRTRAAGGARINGGSISMGLTSRRFATEPRSFPKGHSVTSKGNFQPANSAILAHEAFLDDGIPSRVWGTAYAAIRLGNGDLGWMKIAVEGNFLGFPNSVAILSWAYNDVPGAPILTGETSNTTANTPEPSSLALALLATGAVGVLAYRRRKAAVSQAAGSAQ
jgi:hypothetical protein